MVAILLLLPFTSNASATQSIDNLLDKYVAVKNALAKDDAAQAATSAASLEKLANAIDAATLPAAQQAVWKKQSAALKQGAKAVSGAKGLAAQRQAFAGLSKAVIALAKAGGTSRKLYVQHCPMAKNSWLNEKEAVENPYYGSEMFACGSVTETLPARK